MKKIYTVMIEAEMTTEMEPEKKNVLTAELEKHLENVLSEIFEEVGASQEDLNFCVDVTFAEHTENHNDEEAA